MSESSYSCGGSSPVLWRTGSWLYQENFAVWLDLIAPASSRSWPILRVRRSSYLICTVAGIMCTKLGATGHARTCSCALSP